MTNTSTTEKPQKSGMGCIIVVCLIVLVGIWNAGKDRDKTTKKAEPIEVVIEKTNYDICIENIKGNESFVDTVYLCPAGYRTIGYGHQIKKGEQFTKITKLQADSILEADFSLSVKEAYRLTGFTGNKNLALAHFFFAFGTSKYQKSTLRSLLMQKEPDRAKIEKEWLKWCNYKDTNGVWHEVPALKKARQFEINLFFGD